MSVSHDTRGSSMTPTTTNNGQFLQHKAVRFSPASSLKCRARSLTTSSLLREPVDYTLRNARPPDFGGTDLPIDFAAYIEQSRAVLESQRSSFERERATFAQERKLWERERLMLKSRIADLEAATNKNAGGGRWAGFATVPSGRGSAAPLSSIGSAPSPGSTDRLKGPTNRHHVWEGSSPDLKPTRVFPDESKKGDIKSHEVEENRDTTRGSLDAALSPRSRARHSQPDIRVPIEKIDSTLDGITLKSSALSPEDVAKIITTLPESSPTRPNPEHTSSFQISLADLGPPDENLTRDAGHTPMVAVGTETDVSSQSPSLYQEDGDEAPLAPQTTICRPYERSDSYFPESDEDPELQGPLGLRNEETADNAFLGELDQRLLDEARRIISGPSGSGNGGVDEADDEELSQGEPEPQLKLKQTTNFGSAFGTSRVW